MGDSNDPIISDAPPSAATVWLRNVVAAVRGRPLTPRPTPPPNDPETTVSDAEPRPVHTAAAATVADSPVKPPRPPKPPRAYPFLSSPRPQSPDEAQRDVHGAPAVWMAPVFLAFALAFALPLLAAVLSPLAPRAAIDGLVHRLPDWTRPLSPMMAGWLWAPWYVALPALLMRLRAAWTTRLAMLDAVGWGMAALALEGAAWLFWGRTVLTSGTFSPAEQTGCWRLLVAEFLFLLLTATMWGPTRRQWVRFEQ